MRTRGRVMCKEICSSGLWGEIQIWGEKKKKKKERKTDRQRGRKEGRERGREGGRQEESKQIPTKLIPCQRSPFH